MSTNKPLRWLFLDLNSYFASIEQELRPELRGKPTAVVPVMADNTCCIAASYEAKAFGVKTGTMVGEARRLCRNIQFVEARHQLYVEYHHKIVEAVESCLPVAVVMSIDEMACRLMGRERQLENALAIAKNIKQTIRKKVGSTLRCSVGLAPNRFLAKVATDIEKPDGLVVIQESDLPQILYKLELQDLPGIGPRMFKRMQKHGIFSVEQLCALSKSEMKNIWNSIIGERFWRWLRGDDIADIPTHRRTVGHSHVLPPDLRTPEGAYAVVQKLVHKAARRLRMMNYWAGALSVFVKFIEQARLPIRLADPLRRKASGGQETWEAKISMVECQDDLTMLEALHRLWKDCPEGEPLAVGITLFDLVPNELHTLSLFEDPKRARLSKAIDAINAKFGTDTIYFGGIHEAKHAAPTRIAFTNIPDLF